MAVEAVGHILPVRNPFHNPVFRPELLYLQAAQAFRRCPVDCIEITVLFLKFSDLLVDML